MPPADNAAQTVALGCACSTLKVLSIPSATISSSHQDHSISSQQEVCHWKSYFYAIPLAYADLSALQDQFLCKNMKLNQGDPIFVYQNVRHPLLISKK